MHVANKKAAWYQFQLALDIPEASVPDDAPPSMLRNAAVTGSARRQLVIDPGPRHDQRPSRARRARSTSSTRAEFMGKPVYLGELRTDDAGRLLFLGGRGSLGLQWTARSGDARSPTTTAGTTTSPTAR